MQYTGALNSSVHFFAELAFSSHDFLKLTHYLYADDYFYKRSPDD